MPSRAYMALTGVPDGDEEYPPWPPPPPPPPGTNRSYIGLAYRNTSYTISATMDSGGLLCVYDGTSYRFSATSVSMPSGGYGRIYIQLPNTTTLQTVVMPSNYIKSVKTSSLRYAKTIDFSGNGFSAAYVESILSDINDFNNSNGTIDLTDNTAIDSGNTDKAELESRGWTVLVDEISGFALSESWSGAGQDSGAFLDANFNTRWAVATGSGSTPGYWLIDTGAGEIWTRTEVPPSTGSAQLTSGVMQTGLSSSLNKSNFSITFNGVVFTVPSESDTRAYYFLRFRSAAIQVEPPSSAYGTTGAVKLYIGLATLTVTYDVKYLAGIWKVVAVGGLVTIYHNGIALVSNYPIGVFSLTSTIAFGHTMTAATAGGLLMYSSLTLGNIEVLDGNGNPAVY